MNDKIEFLEKVLTSDNVVEEIRKNLSRLIQIIPEIKYMIGFEHQHPHHHLDVWEHTLLALSFSRNNFDVRLTLLLHDIGKPFSWQQDGNIRHFYGHAAKSKEIAYKTLLNLGYNKQYINEICYMVSMHDTPLKEDFILNNKQLAKKIYQVQKCDAKAHNPAKSSKRFAYLEKIKPLIYNQKEF